MADNNDGNSLAPFTYIWAIENFPAFLSPSPILSPIFIVDCYRKSHWHLGIAESDCHVQCFVKRQGDDDGGPETDLHSSEISLLDTEGCPLITEKIERSFQKGDTYEILTFALIKDVFGTRKDKFLFNETLTLRFRCFSIQKKINRINTCFARTRLDIQRRSCLWTIKNFSSHIEKEEASQMDDPQHFDLMEKAYLEANRESFLPVGMLTLRFEFILGIGIAHEEIESYRFTPYTQKYIDGMD
ncbi:speckle-type POZ protein [Trichonephila inaurata madagascariensis]|uniref:Speckle-type POZ protein n=1 Tax=Trichonephila inaurata madagascariensis TaxID=2747483 RepID=A0A8X7CQJ2_9ARAC|nr:speckle-type POZ protein [Trichonephila inaurata madagascariensis]